MNSKDNKAWDAMIAMKKANDTSAGNVVNDTPVDIEQMSIDYSILDNLSVERPRLLINKKGVETFRKELKSNPEFSGWKGFQDSVTNKWLDFKIHEEPKAYPPETVGKASLWRPYWRTMYIECQEALNAIRANSIAGIILENDAMIKKAKGWLTSLVAYDPQGPSARAYNDEASFRVIAGIAWGYDWLYDHLTDEEKAKTKEILIVRLEEIMSHLKDTIDLFANPLNSHGVRSISSAIVPTCIALYGDYEPARDYLEYSLQYYSEFYPPWGGDDGAWSEGPDTAMAFLGESFDLIKSYTGIDMFQKEFYKNTGDFILHCMPPRIRRASFCDQSSMGDLPGLKLGYNIRQFAGLTQNGQYMWYLRKVSKHSEGATDKFYNYGWWDFDYDTLRFQHLWNEPKEVAPSDEPLLKVFPNTGWAAFHSKMTDEENHTCMIFKSSPFGSISHSHGDQTAFTIHANDETLACITGYYGGYGVTMHTKWRRQTFSKNAILIGGKGQYGESKVTGFKDHVDSNNLKYSGIISAYNEDPTKGDLFVEGDATTGYSFFTPEIKSYKRRVTFVGGKYFVIKDSVSLDVEKDITWLMHTTFKTETSSNKFRIVGEKGKLDVYFVDQDENITSIKPVEGFGDVDPIELEGLEIHRHVEATFKAKKEHTIITVAVPSKINDKAEVSYKINGNKLSLTVDGESFEVSI